MNIPISIQDTVEKQYFQPGEKENPELMLRRIAKFVAGVEGRCWTKDQEPKSQEQVKEFEEELFQTMAQELWIPSSPYLMNAGTKVPMLLACFVLGIEDDLGKIYDTLKDAALVHKMGGKPQ